MVDLNHGGGDGPSWLSQFNTIMLGVAATIISWFGTQTWGHARRLASIDQAFKDLRESIDHMEMDNLSQHRGIVERLGRIETLLMTTKQT